MKVYQKWFLLQLLLLVLKETSSSFNDGANCTKYGSQPELSSRRLSRRKRFLLFPDGSSFQLVFCVQNIALIGIGDIFLLGNTAALAWSLPKDPSFLTMFKDKDIFGAQRRPDVRQPTMTKRSIKSKSSLNREKRNLHIDKKKMHERQMNREFLKTKHMNDHSIRFHRSSRIDLYEKLERLFEVGGQDGRQCVLRKLCESAQLPKQQATFLQEILHVVFKFPKITEVSEEAYKVYDEAHTDNVACSTIYPGCVNIDVINSL